MNIRDRHETKLPMDQGLPNLPEHLISHLLFSGVRVARSLVLCVCLVDRCLSFCPFCFGHCLSVLLRFMDSDYLFDIFKFFLINARNIIIMIINETFKHI